MKALPKNWLSLNKMFCLSFINQKILTCLLVFLLGSIGKGQTFTNLVPNGSFETFTACPSSGFGIESAPPWTGPCNNSVDYYNSCVVSGNFDVPNYGGTGPFSYFYLLAKEGVAYAALYAYQLNYREYLQVKLNDTLEANKCYYVEFYAANSQATKYKCNNISASLISSAYTNTSSTGNLITIPAHITNYGNPVLDDTVKWHKISGLYQANGTEKHIIMGNFKDDSNTDTVNLFPPGTWQYNLPPLSYIFIDAVSVYSINPSGNLPWSYRDTTVTLGDSVYIGNNIGGNFNPSWYTYSGTFIATNAGIYVKPVSTSSYVVQYTVCGVSRSDTVKVTVTGVGIDELNSIDNNLKLYPQPSQDILNIELSVKMKDPFNRIKLFDNLGRMIREEEIVFLKNKTTLNLKDLANGIYFITISNQNNESITKKLVITK